MPSRLSSNQDSMHYALFRTSLLLVSDHHAKHVFSDVSLKVIAMVRAGGMPPLAPSRYPIRGKP